MTTKIGMIIYLRVAIGLALIAAALGLFGPAYQSTWGWIRPRSARHASDQLVLALHGHGKRGA